MMVAHGRVTCHGWRTYLREIEMGMTLLMIAVGAVVASLIYEKNFERKMKKDPLYQMLKHPEDEEKK